MPPKSKTERDKQEIAATDVGSLTEALESPHEKELKELRDELEERKKIAEGHLKQIDVLHESLEHVESVNAELLQNNCRLQDELVRTYREVDLLVAAKETGKFDKTIHLAGVPYKIWHQSHTKEFFEDIKKRIVPEEAICLAVVKA